MRKGRFGTTIGGGVLALVVAGAVHPMAQGTPAQAAPGAVAPTFEAVSIKPSESLETGGTIRTTGGLTAPNVPIHVLLQIAFDLKSTQVVGGPDWLKTDRYAVIARAATNPSRVELQQMLQAMLVERFSLVVHRETRDLPGYALERLRADRLGPRLRPRTVACGAPRSAAGDPSAAPAKSCGFTMGTGRLDAGGVGMDVLIAELVRATGGVVEDRTGLSGQFDIELEWSPLETAAGTDAPPVVFTAVQDQLGLRLRSASIPTPVLVIDRIDRPRDN